MTETYFNNLGENKVLLNKNEQLKEENKSLKEELEKLKRKNYIAIKELKSVINDIKNEKEFKLDNEEIHDYLPIDCFINFYGHSINYNENVTKEILVIFIIILFYNTTSFHKIKEYIGDTDIFIPIFRHKDTMKTINIDNIQFNVQDELQKDKISINDCVRYIKINLNNEIIKVFLKSIDKFIDEFNDGNNLVFNIIEVFDEINCKYRK